MKSKILALVLLPLVCCSAKPRKAYEPVNFSRIHIEDGFWSPRLEKHKNTTLAVCIDNIENKSGRIANFENAAKGAGQHSGIFYDDSDVYKALEGMAYSLQNSSDPEMEAKCDEWIDKFAAAQQANGYINTYYTLTDLQNRWRDMDMHEMYCAGHMIEAAVAYYNVTGKRKLLDVSIRMADHMMSVFGPDKRHWVPGHEEIELALVKLYKTTGEKKYLDFAYWLLEERGHGYGDNGNGTGWSEHMNTIYHQDDVPLRDFSDAGGHSVRLMYLLCGMADVASYTGDSGYLNALLRLWEDVVCRNMYITGGIGSSYKNEGFTEDYDLPNQEAYCETCASVGMVLWNWRMNQMSGDAKYADILEKAMYNGALAGISLAGDKFFYVNPLESYGFNHRQEWYGTACCPSQICRFLPSIGNYIYGVSDKALWINLFIGNNSALMKMETSYPWDGSVKMTLGPEGAAKREIRIRIPGWCHEYVLLRNGKPVKASVQNGYAIMKGVWKRGDVITLDMKMDAQLEAADPRVKQDVGKRAVVRGPLVYCIEESDNPNYDNACVTTDAPLCCTLENNLLGGVVSIKSPDLKFIPYYAWDNRESGRMKVWVDLKQ